MDNESSVRDSLKLQTMKGDAREDTVECESGEEERLMNNNVDWNIKMALKWNNLTFTINESKCFQSLRKCNLRDVFKPEAKIILHTQSGFVSNGCLMAVMGKSGSGKSTLIESLTGRRTKGLNGDITVNVDYRVAYFMDEKRIKIAFLPQNDCLIETLTVKESIIFASKLKNQKFDNKKHQNLCDDLLAQLDLHVCKNVRISNCSGGQKKRLAVATELVSKPTILILDEPTSGLDSSSALQCVQLLRKLTESTKDPLAIIVTIHQPSAKIFYEFHKLYLLSYDGKCIYNGPLSDLLTYFSEFGVACPQFHNPADHAIEIASGEGGKDVVERMAQYQSKRTDISEFSHQDETKIDIPTIIDSMMEHSSKSSMSQFLILIKRTVLTTIRDPVLTFFRFFMHFFVAVCLTLLYKSDIGDENGCITARTDPNSTLNFSIDEIKESQTIVVQNLGFLFFSLMFTLYAAIMPTVMVFPLEMTVFTRERTNGWYSCLSYYLAKTIADIPFQLICSCSYTTLTYYLTGQVDIMWRFFTFLGLSVLVSFLGQSIGLLIGAIWMRQMNTAVFLAPLSLLPPILFGGFFLKISLMPEYLKPVSYMSFVRYAFESMVICIYGFDRCHVNDSSVVEETTNGIVIRFLHYLLKLNMTYSGTRPILQALVLDRNMSLSDLESFDVHFRNFSVTDINFFSTNENESFAINELELKNEDFWFQISMLFLWLFALRVITYFIVVFKTSRRS